MPEPTPPATYTLEGVLKSLGAPTAEDLELFSVRSDPADLGEAGAKISSSRILTDVTRWLGNAGDYVRQLPPAEEADFGFSMNQLRVIGHDVAELDRRHTVRERAKATTSGTRVVEQTELDVANEEGRNERDTVRNNMANAALGDTILLKQLDVFDGDFDVAVADQLAGIAAVADTWLASGKPVAKRLPLNGITPERLARTRKVESKVREVAARAKGAMVSGPVTQATLDQQDGVVLAHMVLMMRFFRRAHELDSAVPKLVPIATRSYFNHPKRAAAKAPETPAVPVNG